jgi:two-component system, response regulator YesN
MSSHVEQYRFACRMISAFTNLEVQLFNAEKELQIHVARYDLPVALEQIRQNALIQMLQQPVSRGQVLVFRDAIQLEFFAAGLWGEAAYLGIVVVGPAISKVFHPHVLRAMNLNTRLPLTMQKELQQSYNTLPLIDEEKQQAIGFFLHNLFTPGLEQPQLIDTTLPVPEDPSRPFVVVLEHNRELIEKRYELENTILHAIRTGNTHLVKKTVERLKEISWPFRLPDSPIRSLKNLALAGNTLCRKAAEQGGVHPLYLDTISGKFAIQIEQAQSPAELLSSNEETFTVYCNLVKEASMAAFPPIVREAVAYLRLHLDQRLNLDALAETLGVSPSHLSRICKKALGITLTDYLNRLRIEEAKFLLDHSNDSLSEIAATVGFYDASYFSNVFRKWEQMTPYDYRQRNLNAHS